jgi:hypothetical protein
MSKRRLDEVVPRAVELELARVLPFTRGPVSEALLPAFDVQIVDGRECCMSLPLEQGGEPVGIEGESSLRKDRDRQERARQRVAFVENAPIRVIDDEEGDEDDCRPEETAPPRSFAWRAGRCAFGSDERAGRGYSFSIFTLRRVLQRRALPVDVICATCTEYSPGSTSSSEASRS